MTRETRTHCPLRRCPGPDRLGVQPRDPRRRSGHPRTGEPPRIIVGGDNDCAPYEFLGQDGEPTGHNVELTRAIADVMGMEVKVRLGHWGRTEV